MVESGIRGQNLVFQLVFSHQIPVITTSQFEMGDNPKYPEIQCVFPQFWAENIWEAESISGRVSLGGVQGRFVPLQWVHCLLPLDCCRDSTRAGQCC